MDGEGTDGSSGGCGSRAGPWCGQGSQALLSAAPGMRQLVALELLSHMRRLLAFTAMAGGRKSKLNQISGFQIEDEWFWVGTMAEV